jgi:hypothetical protein
MDSNTQVVRIFAATFGQIVYSRCMNENVTYADGDWMAEFVLKDGTKIKEVELGKREEVVELGDLFAGNKSSPLIFVNRPEQACYSICQKQLEKDCTFFTYDGISEDRWAPDTRMHRCRVTSACLCMVYLKDVKDHGWCAPCGSATQSALELPWHGERSL